jgi:hypothetical protein
MKTRQLTSFLYIVTKLKRNDFHNIFESIHSFGRDHLKARKYGRKIAIINIE